MKRLIKKAVFPVAGLGTRFLPATKANPKEMLPIVDKPLIQYAAEEAVAAGITELIFVIGRNKHSISDHFDKAYELESKLEGKHQDKLLAVVRNILPPNISCVYIRQSEPLGLGHAVLCARPVINGEPFAVLLADDLIDCNGKNCLAQMIDVYSEYRAAMIAVESVPKQDTDRYGIVEVRPIKQGISEIRDIVEKPAPSVAPSNLAVVGRYILPPGIMAQLAMTGKGAGGEIQLTDAIGTLLKEEKAFAWEFQGQRYDCGSKLGYLQATVDYALKHPEVKRDFGRYLQIKGQGEPKHDLAYTLFRDPVGAKKAVAGAMAS